MVTYPQRKRIKVFASFFKKKRFLFCSVVLTLAGAGP
jgi:hypothetical protein